MMICGLSTQKKFSFLYQIAGWFRSHAMTTAALFAGQIRRFWKKSKVTWHKGRYKPQLLFLIQTVVGNYNDS